jgi:hypothetical protein
MSIAGNLKTMELAELLQWLSNSAKTGTLVFDNGKVEKKIFFQGGRIISSASTDPNEYLGSFLVSHGFATEDQVNTAVHLQRDNGQMLGANLVSTGVLGKDQLEHVLRVKAEETIFHVFSWEEGDFRFIDGELPPYPMVPINLDVTSIILEGTHRTDEWSRIRQLVPTLDAVPVGLVDLATIPDLDEGTRHILTLVDDQRTIAEIQRLTYSSDFYVCRALFEQILQGYLKVVLPRNVSGPPTAAAAPVTPAAPAEREITGQELLDAGLRHLSQGTLDRALRFLRAAKCLEPTSPVLLKKVKEAEDSMRNRVEGDGVRLNSLPKLARSMNEILNANLNPQEGFILTRINGTYDIQAILRISPMDQLEALLVFWKLRREGHVSF